ncbi:hypothetical protein WN55_05834 [Dufourea novaeangliae]|uniref:Uncharacterized protein n=1 Tax=Dufourea novaeangliae TaxID=178035 RepID=A0A154P1W6_DUFNO|nr:hypothetical protein WN55_05834 [Dufourea novaeangliae]
MQPTLQANHCLTGREKNTPGGLRAGMEKWRTGMVEHHLVQIPVIHHLIEEDRQSIQKQNEDIVRILEAEVEIENVVRKVIKAPGIVVRKVEKGTDDFPIEPRFKEGILDAINSEGFTPKQFSSSNTKEKKFKNIVIDIAADTIQVPTVADIPSGSESIFHSSIILDQEARFDKWVKKLYTLRQKAITDLAHSNIT